MKIIKDKSLNFDEIFKNVKFVRCLNLGARLENCIWESGVWKNGIWKNYIWKNGIWENGIWESGRWEKGKGKNNRIWKS